LNILYKITIFEISFERSKIFQNGFYQKVALKNFNKKNYSKNYDLVPLPLPSRYRFWACVTDRYRISSNVTLPLPYRYLTVTDRY
jgi:hypothetical protein